MYVQSTTRKMLYIFDSPRPLVKEDEPGAGTETAAEDDGSFE